MSSLSTTTEYICPSRNIKFAAGDRCHWFKYSFDQVVVDGGLGTIIEIIPISIGGCSYVSLLVLMDNGGLETFPSNDVDIDFDE